MCCQDAERLMGIIASGKKELVGPGISQWSNALSRVINIYVDNINQTITKKKEIRDEK